MADEVELDAAGNPKSQPVDDPSAHETRKADSHRHVWQGMRAGGVRYQMCAECGKQREKSDE